MKQILFAVICLALAATLAAPAQAACTTKLLKAPAAVDAYLKEKKPETGDARAVLAEAFKRDKAYYDTTGQEYCSLQEGRGAPAQVAMSTADHKIMDLLIDKWQKVADTAKSPAATTPAH